MPTPFYRKEKVLGTMSRWNDPYGFDILSDTMTRREKKKLQDEFLKKAGPNAATFKAMMDVLSEVAFYMKDDKGRIMALNRRNCDICNIHDELDAIGRQSGDIFPHQLAQSYVANDKIVRKKRRPLINYRDAHTADRSNDCNVESIFPLFDKNGTKARDGAHCSTLCRRHLSGKPVRTGRHVAVQLPPAVFPYVRYLTRTLHHHDTSQRSPRTVGNNR